MKKKNIVRITDAIGTAVLGALIIWGGFDILFNARTVFVEVEGVVIVGIALMFFLASSILYNQRKLSRAIEDINNHLGISPKEKTRTEDKNREEGDQNNPNEE